MKDSVGRRNEIGSDGASVKGNRKVKGKRRGNGGRKRRVKRKVDREGSKGGRNGTGRGKEWGERKKGKEGKRIEMAKVNVKREEGKIRKK